MRTRTFLRLLPTGLLSLCVSVSRAQQMPQTTSVTVNLDQVEHAISPTLHGIFFEDINFAADGGLYPERIKNGSFEFSPDPLLGWHRVEQTGGSGQVTIASEHALHANNPHYLRLTIDPATQPGKGYGLSNDGYRGIGVTSKSKFVFSVFSRCSAGTSMRLSVELQSSDNKSLGKAELSVSGAEWKKYSVEIESSKTDGHAHLLMTSDSPGSVDLDMVSLFPTETFNNHPNGLRPDLVQLLKDLHPKFIRFPGGCIVEGRTLDNRYQWKDTIGDLPERKLILNRWNTEFNHRPTPDYFQSYGLGFFEFFQLCEDTGASPLPIVNCGMACQYNTGELAPMAEIDPYAQDALDLIEFANGSVDTPWGKKRAAMGHPGTFNLKRIGIGNEQWGPHYIERYAQISKIIKAKYPEIEFVAAAGPSPDGALFDFAWKELSGLGANILDEHYYANPDWFIKHAGRYDKYPRTGPKVFAGEFAAQSVGIARPDNKNNWRCALAEAAFMTGLERNSDLVVMSSYAPLLAHVDAWQWTPNLIWFDNLKSFGTPSYYVQQMFGANTGTSLLKTDLQGSTENLFCTSSRDDQTGDLILKYVNTATSPRSIKITLKANAPFNGTMIREVLSSDDLEAVNSLQDTQRVSPVISPAVNVESALETVVPPSSLTVLRLTPK